MNNYQKEQQIVEWLENYNSYKAGIENLKQNIEDIAEEGMGISYDNEPVSGGNAFNSVVENAVIKMDKLEIQKRIKAMTNIVNSIDRALESLTDTERQVIINRCIKGKYYYQFTYEIGVGEKTAKRYKKEALRKMSIAIFGID